MEQTESTLDQIECIEELTDQMAVYSDVWMLPLGVTVLTQRHAVDLQEHFDQIDAYLNR